MSVRDKLHRVARDFVDRRTYSAASENSSGALHNKGEVALSYAEPIAKHIIGDDGKPYILLNVQKYSVTTSKHQQAIRLAAQNAGRYVIEVREGRL